MTFATLMPQFDALNCKLIGLYGLQPLLISRGWFPAERFPAERFSAVGGFVCARWAQRSDLD
jgi:hypothetical protein